MSLSPRFFLLSVLGLVAVGCAQENVPEYLRYEPTVSDNSGSVTLDLCTFSGDTDATALVEIQSVTVVNRCSSNPPNNLNNHYRVQMDIVSVLRGSFSAKDTYIIPKYDAFPITSGMRGLVTIEDIESVQPTEAGVGGFLPVTFLDSAPSSTGGHESVIVDLPTSVEDLRTELNSGQDHCMDSPNTKIPKAELDSVFVAGAGADAECGGFN